MSTLLDINDLKPSRVSAKIQQLLNTLKVNKLNFQLQLNWNKKKWLLTFNEIFAFILIQRPKRRPLNEYFEDNQEEVASK